MSNLTPNAVYAKAMADKIAPSTARLKRFLFLSSYAHLVLDPATDRVSGGAELQVALLARELVRLGYEVVIISGDTGQVDGSLYGGVRIRNGGRFHTGRIGEMIGALPRIYSLLREERPDYVFVLGWTAWLFVLYLLRGLIGYRLGFICGLDTEVSGKYRQENPLRGSLFEYAMRRADVRFAMTEYQRRLFENREMNCGMYRNLILPRKEAARLGLKTVDFLWIARCQPIKRPHLFLDLAERIPEAKFEMVCVREDEALWESVYQRAKKIPNVHFIERVPYHEVQVHYDIARVFVNTSTYEGWPNSFIQAGLGQTALLSLRVKPDTLFQDYQLGFCANDDFEALVKQAWIMWHNQEETERMGRESERFVQEMHDNQRETARFLEKLLSDVPKKKVVK